MTTLDQETISKMVLKGDLSGLNPKELIAYYNYRCQLAGLDPATKPFDVIEKAGRRTLATNKSAGEQLRRIHNISIIEMNSKIESGVYFVTVKAQTKDGRSDIANGIKAIEGLKGEMLANAIMSAETKAKNRVTLSLCSLGMIDETEAIDSGFVISEPSVIDGDYAAALPEPRLQAHFYDVNKAPEAKRDAVKAFLRKQGAQQVDGNGVWASEVEIVKCKQFEVQL